MTEKSMDIGDRIRSYRELCAQERSIPLFSRDWWLDATVGEKNWDVALVKAGSEMIAAMPYTIQKRAGFTLIGQPRLSQNLGPWMRPYSGKDGVGQQKKIHEELLGQLPRFDHFRQAWHYSQTNWTSFYWQGFSQSTRYTYVLADLSDEKRLWEGLHGNIRKEIRKAKERFNLRVRDDADVGTFLSLNKMVFKRQGVPLPYSEAFVKRIDEVSAARGCRKILVAEDGAGRIHAGVYIVWDDNSAYYLMGGSDPGLRTSGATSLCMWEAIRHSASVSQRFDFEGSMLEPVERFFREFGAAQVPYFLITKTPSRMLRIREFIMELARK